MVAYNRSGVSPVIGILLLVAITVVLAAVIGTFSFSLTQHAKSAPKAQFILNDASDKINDDIFFRALRGIQALDAILTISHVGGDPIKCQDIQIIVKDKTNGWSWVLRYDGGRNITADLNYGAGSIDPVSKPFYAFYDPTKNGWTPVIFVFPNSMVKYLEQVGGPEYSIKNAGIIQTGDTLILTEGNVTIYGIGGYGGGQGNFYHPNYDAVDPSRFTRWLAEIFANDDGDIIPTDVMGNSFVHYWKEIWNSTNTPADIEVTIIHVPTKSIIYTGTVKVQ